jgi:SnoaL-like protein
LINLEPMQVVVEFIKRINTGDPDEIAELLTDDHIFQDALGKRFIGKENLRQSWKRYFAQIADYKIHGEDFFVENNVVAIFGTASGTSKINGQFTPAGFWEIPAAWKGVIRDGLIAQWCVYAESSLANRPPGKKD